MLIKNTSLALAAFVPASTHSLEASALTTVALALATGVNSVGASLPASATDVGWGGRKSVRPPVFVPGVKKVDLGVLKPEQRRAVECPLECDDGFVGYCSGVPIDPDITCGDGATGDVECCSGANACFQFTGCVKKDGSCAGEYACYKATSAIVEGSCKADSACESLQMTGKVENSCNANYACWKMAYYGGKVEALIKSCNGKNACENFARPYSKYRAEVGVITKSCNRDGVCMGVASLIKSITKTCNNDVHKPCRVLDNYGSVGHLTKFTHTAAGKKYTRDSIGSIEECNAQCVNDSECRGIKWKEHTRMPCRFFGGEISQNTCGGRNVCITV